MRLSLVFSIAVLLCGLWNLYDAHQRLQQQTWSYGKNGSNTAVALEAAVTLKNEWAVPSTASSSSLTSTPHHNSNATIPLRQGKDVDGDNDPDTVPHRIPTHHACDGHDGIYHIAMGDLGGAAGTIFFQFVIGQVLYAERNNLKPWVHLNNVSYVVYDPVVHSPPQQTPVRVTALTGRNATYIQRPDGHARDFRPGPLDMTQSVHQEHLEFAGTGVWEHYFEPVSDFVPGDSSCQDKLYTTLDLYLITPGIHGFSDWAPKCWRYHYLPDYVSKPHIPLAEWLEPQRKIGHETAAKYIHFRPYIQQIATRANPDCSRDNACLGLHIRHSDKSAGRRVIEVAEFLPFAQAFVDAGGQHIYLATDSSQVLKEVQTQWPESIRNRVRTMGDNIIRSSNDKAVFDLGSHHRTNQEVLVEILALSQCQFLLHGLSAVSESSIWINLDLHVQSVNLEDPDHLTANSFATLVELVLRGESQDKLPRPLRTNEWWKAPTPKQPSLPSTSNQKGCDGYNGVLHISAAGDKASTGAAFFTWVLNQLLYADMYNLKPWVHLSNETSKLLFDPAAHGNDSAIRSLDMATRMTVGMESNAEAGDSAGNRVENLGKPMPVSGESAVSLADHLIGNGIWKSYFEPVSDFAPGDKSCRDKPIVSMPERVISSSLQYGSWSVKAWRYDKVPLYIWNPDKLPLKEWYAPMRQRAHEIVQMHYRFQPQIVQRADEVNPVTAGQPPCLAIHLRNNDKTGRYRKKVKADKFEPYVDAFERAGGQVVYIATDSNRILHYIEKNYPDRLSKIIRTQGRWVVRADKAIRGKREFPTHFIEDHHRVNSETLVDILAMSRCELLLHGFSTVSEAAIYLNPALHNNSVNLEDPGRMSPDEFGELARKVIEKGKGQGMPSKED